MIMFIGCFVDYMLERLGCGHAWRGRMAECISSTLFSILVDGSPTRFFKSSWGFGWGHPFSPFLFTLIEDFFLICGFEAGMGHLIVSHLHFADHWILFYMWMVI
eukprot:TRINITY_DN9384_c2_g5_i1.p1 TRINITY_DN9384_c2_g5~~TRINITY_DN9384_c2_g5_i1.p1  ORF type:complete len:104 (-),score=10.95 TRINITY_DN9384_c2_g5_i1:41-352(-)